MVKKVNKIFFKKNIFLFLLFTSLFLINTGYALDVNIKETYSPLETMILEIQGEFIQPLNLDNIQLYSGRRFIPTLSYLGRIDNKYLFYLNLRNEQRNYTLVFEDIHYSDNGVEKIEDVSFNFSVQGEKADFSVKPGFIITNKDFDLTLKNNNKEIKVNANFLDTTKEIELNYKQEKKVLFSISGVNESKITTLVLEYGNTKYEIPVGIFPQLQDKDIEEKSENKTIKKEDVLVFLDIEDSISKTFFSNQTEEKIVSLYNLGNENITNIEIIISEEIQDIVYIEKKYQEIKVLEPEDSIDIKFVFFSEQERNISGEIKAVSENYSTSFLMNLYIAKDPDYIPPEPSENNLDPNKVCSDYGFFYCREGEVCPIVEQDIRGVKCCIHECEKQELITETRISGFKIFVIILIILSLIVIFFIYKKQKIKKKTGDEVIKERTEDYKKRFQPKSTWDKLSKS
jgi:hypothetical protein